MNNKKNTESSLGRGAKAVGHGITAIIKIPADGLVKGANLIAPKPQSNKELEEEKSLSIASKKVAETKTLKKGMLGLGKGIVKGVSGVVMDPYKGAKTSGFKGFAKGVGSGLVGVVASPVQGVSDLMESVDQTIDGTNRPAKPNYFSSSLRTQKFRSNQGGIPNIMFECITQIQMRGIDVKGLFRVPGNHLKIQETQKLLQAGKKVNFYELDILLIASILKLWLRELPDPLIPFNFYDKLIALGSTLPQLTEEEKIDQKINLRNIIRNIRRPHIDCLSYLILFLSKVAKNSEVNKMHAKNLATVIAPNILYRPIDVNADIETTRAAAMQTSEEIGHTINIVTLLISDVEFFFFDRDSDSKNEEKKVEQLDAGSSKRLQFLSTSSAKQERTPYLALTDVKSDTQAMQLKPPTNTRRHTTDV